MKRAAINPANDWGAGFEMNQAERISEFNQLIKFSGQTALVADSNAEMGLRVEHPGDLRKQLELILKTIDGLLEQAGLSRSNIIHVIFYATDLGEFLNNYEVYAAWIKKAEVRPTQTALGISSLVMPDMLIEVEVTAAS